MGFARFKRSSKSIKQSDLGQSSVDVPTSEATQDLKPQSAVPQPPPPYQPSSTDSPLVTIIVGEDERRFSIHKSILCSKSHHLAGMFKDSDSKQLSCEDIVLKQEDGYTSEAFEVVASWFYDGKPALDKVPGVTACKGQPKGDSTLCRQIHLALTKVYIQSYYLEIVQLQTDIFDLMFQDLSWALPNMEAMHLLTQTDLKETPLERFHVDLIAYNLCYYPEVIRLHANGWHRQAQEFLQKDCNLAYKVLKQLCQRRETKEGKHPTSMSKSHYL